MSTSISQAEALHSGSVNIGGSLITATLVFASMSPASGQVNEISSRWSRDVAHVSLDRNGRSQIKFNPRRCRELGPDLCEFFRAHEYGHVNLRHLERGVPKAQAEAEADRWAASHASPAAVRAARNYFRSGHGGSRIHGTAEQRAARMDARLATANGASTVSRHSANSSRRITGRIVNVVPRSYAGNTAPLVRSLRVVRSPAAPGIATAPQFSAAQRFSRQTSPNRTQIKRSTTNGYVPRGDFLSPR